MEIDPLSTFTYSIFIMRMVLQDCSCVMIKHRYPGCSGRPGFICRYQSTTTSFFVTRVLDEKAMIISSWLPPSILGGSRRSETTWSPFGRIQSVSSTNSVSANLISAKNSSNKWSARSTSACRCLLQRAIASKETALVEPALIRHDMHTTIKHANRCHGLGLGFRLGVRQLLIMDDGTSDEWQ